MGSFLAQAGLFLVIVAVLFAPVFFLARRRGQHSTIKSFAIAGLVVVALCAAVGVSSQRLVDQCIAVGNTQCYDRGSTGMQALFLAGFGVAAIIRSYFLWKD